MQGERGTAAQLQRQQDSVVDSALYITSSVQLCKIKITSAHLNVIWMSSNSQYAHICRSADVRLSFKVVVAEAEVTKNQRVKLAVCKYALI